MTDEKVSLSSSIKAALAKKHAAQHPDSKEGKSEGKVQKRTAPPTGAGRPMKKSAGRGR